MTIRLKDDEHFAVELTPMIDVVFLLIVFFLVATTFHRLERELSVVVPRSETGESGEKGPDPIVVNVLEDGRLVVEGNALDLPQLESLLVRQVDREPRTKALIRAHSQLVFERVIEVADACRKARAAVSFATLEGRERER